jgi:hypothetical protein
VGTLSFTRESLEDTTYIQIIEVVFYFLNSVMDMQCSSYFNFIYYLLTYFELGSCYVTQAGLELMILLLQLPEG